MGSLQPASFVGGYKLIRLLGEGGMGEVWQAYEERADRLVALKFIQPLLLRDPRNRVRFANEAKTLGKLDHDRVVPLYAVIEEGEHFAFVLRFIDGGSLADRIDSQFPLPQSFLLSSAREILGALGDAHSRGIIHRDMKPQNILVDRQDRSFLTDFGIAISDTQERATRGESAIGTPHYMSPEQIARPRDIAIAKGGHRTDIYSYGIVLYEMLTGQVPFGPNSGADETFAIHQAHCQEAPAPPSSLNPAISPQMEAVVLHCLEKDPDLRPQTCAELLGEIEAAIQGSQLPHAPRRVTVLDPTGGNASPSQTKPIGGSATLVETGGPATQSVSKPTVSRQPLLIAAAAILLLTGGGGAWWVLHSGSPQPASPEASPNAPSGATQPKTGDAAPADKKAAIHQPLAPNPSPQTPKPDSANHPQAPSVDPDAEAKQRAAALASQAEDQFHSGHDCDAEAKLIAANKIYPVPGYAETLKTYTDGCNNP